MRIGCCVDKLEEIAIAARLGYDFVDLAGWMVTGAVQETKTTLTAAGISAIGVHASLPGDLALVGSQRDWAALRTHAQLLAQGGRALGVRFIGIGSPKSRILPAGFPITKADGQMTEFLTEIAAMTGVDITILLEPLHPGQTNYINTLEKALALAERVGRLNCGVVLDLYHFLMARDGAALSGELSAAIRYLHIADPQERAFPSASTGPELFELLHRLIRLGYTGDIAIEAIPRDFAADAKAGLEIMRKMLTAETA